MLEKMSRRLRVVIGVVCVSPTVALACLAFYEVIDGLTALQLAKLISILLGYAINVGLIFGVWILYSVYAGKKKKV